MESESKICFDSHLLFQGMNLNKIVVLGSILATSLLLPIHLDEWDALNSSSPKHPGIQYLKNLNEQRANRLKESQELDKQLNLENGEEMIVKVSNDTGFEKERVTYVGMVHLCLLGYLLYCLCLLSLL